MTPGDTIDGKGRTQKEFFICVLPFIEFVIHRINIASERLTAGRDTFVVLYEKQLCCFVSFLVYKMRLYGKMTS